MYTFQHSTDHFWDN